MRRLAAMQGCERGAIDITDCCLDRPNYAFPDIPFCRWVRQERVVPADLARRLLDALVQSGEIAPQQPRVLAAAAMVAVQRKDWAEADRRLKKARDLSVGSDNVWEKTGWFLVTVGRPREAAQYMRRAGVAEPLLAFYPAAVAAMYEMCGDLEQAAIELVKSRPLFGDPGFPAGNATDRHAGYKWECAEGIAADQEVVNAVCVERTQ